MFVKILLSIFKGLLTEMFIKRTIYALLKEVSKRTDTEFDNEMVIALGKEWGMS